MGNDPYRRLIQQRELDIAIRGLMREEAVVNYYAGRGYKVLSQSDPETRQVFGIPATQKAADVVVEISPGRAIIAEVKGSDIESALSQLRNTAVAVRRRYVFIECKIFTSNPPPEGEFATFGGGLMGYRAMRVFHRAFPGEWLLSEYQERGGTSFVRIENNVVAVIFGPYA
jgi:hypothetical protein